MPFLARGYGREGVVDIWNFFHGGCLCGSSSAHLSQIYTRWPLYLDSMQFNALFAVLSAFVRPDGPKSRSCQTQRTKTSSFTLAFTSLKLSSASNSEMPYSLHKILAPVPPNKAGPINAVLFFDDGTLLATGGTWIFTDWSCISSQVLLGDGQILRIWDVRSGDCQQELRDPHWGQITNLSLMLNAGGRTQGMIVGTGRGIVSIYPWHDLTQVNPPSLPSSCSTEMTPMQQFNRQAVTTTTVFTDVPVESQALDCTNSRLAVASHLGTINMYAIQNHSMWSLLPSHPYLN